MADEEKDTVKVMTFEKDQVEYLSGRWRRRVFPALYQ
jgi:hypothetical protein